MDLVFFTTVTTVPSWFSNSSFCSAYSEGCAAAVKRILGKIDGVTDIQTDVAAKTVVVQADQSVSPEFMLEKLQKVSNDYALLCQSTFQLLYDLSSILFHSGLRQVESQWRWYRRPLWF